MKTKIFSVHNGFAVILSAFITYIYVKTVFVLPSYDLFDNYTLCWKWYVGFIHWGASILIALAFFILFLSRPSRNFFGLLVLLLIKLIFSRTYVQTIEFKTLGIIVAMLQFLLICALIIGSIHSVLIFKNIRFKQFVSHLSTGSSPLYIKRYRLLGAFVFTISFASSSLWNVWFSFNDPQWHDFISVPCYHSAAYLPNNHGVIASVHINQCGFFEFDRESTFIYIYPKGAKERSKYLVYRNFNGVYTSAYNGSIEWINKNTVLIKVSTPSDHLRKKWSLDDIFVKIEVINRDWSLNSTKDVPPKDNSLNFQTLNYKGGPLDIF